MEEMKKGWSMTFAKFKAEVLNILREQLIKDLGEADIPLGIFSSALEIANLQEGDPNTVAYWKQKHMEMVKKAIVEGKEIPPEVLAEYPMWKGDE